MYNCLNIILNSYHCHLLSKTILCEENKKKKSSFTILLGKETTQI